MEMTELLPLKVSPFFSSRTHFVEQHDDPQCQEKRA